MIFGIMGWVGLWGLIHEGHEGGLCLNCDFWDYGMDMIWGDCPRRARRGAKGVVSSSVPVIGDLGLKGSNSTRGISPSSSIRWTSAMASSHLGSGTVSFSVESVSSVVSEGVLAPSTALRSDRWTCPRTSVGVYAEDAVQQHSSGGDAVVVFDLSTTLGIVLRIVVGSVDVCQSGYDGKPVVGDFENVLLDVRLYRKGVERFWGYAVLGFGLFGLGFGDGFGACLGYRAEGLVEGVVDLGDEPGRLGFFVGDGGWRLAKCRRFTKRPPYRVRGRLYVGVVGCGSRVGVGGG